MTPKFSARAVARLIALAGGPNRRVWRLGHVSDPLGFVPRAYCSWQHRFDDPEQEYRTIYCAEDPVTCLREVLGDLRPNTKARAEFEQFQRDQGITEDALHRPASQVTVKWREEHALAPAVVERDGPLVDLDDRVLLEQLADTHAALLHQYKMPQLDLTQITSKIRPVTQATSRDLYDRGAAGLLFRSNHDALRCIVLFEGRARLIADGRPTPMTKNHSALVRVCGEYGLVLRSPSSSRTRRRKWQP